MLLRRGILLLFELLTSISGHSIPPLLQGILELFPLDTYVLAPVSLMQLVPDDVGRVNPVIWDAYKEMVNKVEPNVCTTQTKVILIFYVSLITFILSF